jgi:hypothetical protein
MEYNVVSSSTVSSLYVKSEITLEAKNHIIFYSSTEQADTRQLVEDDSTSQLLTNSVNNTSLRAS